MHESSDCIIIGGGINGASIAFHLAKHKAQVVLLEKSYIGGGPSGLSSAIIRQHYSNPVTIRMALDSLKVWQNFPEIVGAEPVFTRTGFLIGVRPEDVAGLQANISLQQAAGVNTRFLDPDELKELEPHIDVVGIGGAAYEPDSGYCDPVEANRGFAAAAKRLGAQIKVGVTATQIRVINGKVTGVETDRGFLPAGQVIVSAGPWSPMLLSKLGIDLPILIARVKVVLLKRPQDFIRHMIWGDFISQVYLRPETGGLMLVGSISPQEETADQVKDPDNFNQTVDVDLQASFAERVALRYPAMSRSHIANSFASLYDITPDWHSIMDAVPGVDGLYLCAGSSGHGFKLAPSVGRMMAQLVLEGVQTGDDIRLFAFDRFTSGALVKGQYEYSILG